VYAAYCARISTLVFSVELVITGIIMPKLRTHKGAKKRLKVTGTGKILRRKSHTGHLFTNKTAKRKRNLRKSALIHKNDEKRMKKLLPYS